MAQSILWATLLANTRDEADSTKVMLVVEWQWNYRTMLWKHGNYDSYRVYWCQIRRSIIFWKYGVWEHFSSSLLIINEYNTGNENYVTVRPLAHAFDQPMHYWNVASGLCTPTWKPNSLDYQTLSVSFGFQVFASGMPSNGVIMSHIQARAIQINLLFLYLIIM